MITANGTFPKAFAVWFKDWERLDVSSFHHITWHWPREIMLPIGSVLRLRKEKIDRTKFKFSELQPVTIHFDGSMDKRGISGNREYTMDLWFARPGDIVVAKIDLKNGAVGIVPNDWGNVAVTGHFAVYEPDRTKLLPEFFHRIIQAKFFKDYLWRNKVGAEGRKEVKLDFFESQKIPLPPLTEQKAIVARWREAQTQIAAARARAEKMKVQIDARFFADLGMSAPAQMKPPKCFVIWWKNLERWDLFFYRADFQGIKESLLKIPNATLGKIAHFTSRQWQKDDFPNGQFQYVEISAVSKDTGIVSSKSVNADDAPSRATTLLREGDLILSTTRPYLGGFAIVDKKYNHCVCSSGFALVDSVDSTLIEKEFLLYFLQSDCGLKQMEQRMTGGLYPAITQDELEKVLIPLPPLRVQREIMARVAAGRAEIARERAAAEKLSREIETEIESRILGKCGQC